MELGVAFEWERVRAVARLRRRPAKVSAEAGGVGGAIPRPAATEIAPWASEQAHSCRKSGPPVATQNCSGDSFGRAGGRNADRNCDFLGSESGSWDRSYHSNKSGLRISTRARFLLILLRLCRRRMFDDCAHFGPGKKRASQFWRAAVGDEGDDLACLLSPLLRSRCISSACFKFGQGAENAPSHLALSDFFGNGQGILQNRACLLQLV